MHFVIRKMGVFFIFAWLGDFFIQCTSVATVRGNMEGHDGGHGNLAAHSQSVPQVEISACHLQQFLPLCCVRRKYTSNLATVLQRNILKELSKHALLHTKNFKYASISRGSFSLQRFAFSILILKWIHASDLLEDKWQNSWNFWVHLARVPR